MVRAKLIHEGMGGFLNPPTHPEHDWSVQTDLRRRPENRGSMSLTAASTCEYLDGFISGAAKRQLADWKAPAIDSPEVQEWIRQVLGYFKGCYRNPNVPESEQWNAGTLVIDKRNPMENPEDHAGVNLIRKYYPTYEPTAEQFAAARWGKP
jgi:hypothetical protein